LTPLLPLPTTCADTLSVITYPYPSLTNSSSSYFPLCDYRLGAPRDTSRSMIGDTDERTIPHWRRSQPLVIMEAEPTSLKHPHESPLQPPRLDQDDRLPNYRAPQCLLACAQDPSTHGVRMKPSNMSGPTHAVLRFASESIFNVSTDE